MFKVLAYSKTFYCLLIFLIVTSCSSVPRGGVATGEIMRPLTVLHKSVNYLMMGSEVKRSANSRTYTSQHHAVGMDLNAGYIKKKERGQLIITILGDRRPYQVTILYKVEELIGSKFKFARYDKGLATTYLKKLNEYLASRPEGRDIIDGFKAY